MTTEQDISDARNRMENAAEAFCLTRRLYTWSWDMARLVITFRNKSGKVMATMKLSHTGEPDEH